MKILQNFFSTVLMVLLVNQTLFAADTMGGNLQGGDEIVLIPLSEHALSITRSKSHITSNANFDFIMLNKHDVIYEDKNQVDDIYLVFHDDVEVGDRIKIRINRGHFNYKIAPLHALPDIVKNVLDPVVFQPKVKPRNQREFEPVEHIQPMSVSQPQVTYVAPKVTTRTDDVKPLPILKPLPTIQDDIPMATTIPVIEEVTPIAESQPVPTLKSSVSYESPIGDSFFEKFTQIFESLVTSLNKQPATTHKPRLKKEMPAEPSAPKGIQEQFDDSAVQENAHVQQHTFTHESPRGIHETFDDSALQEHAQMAPRQVFTQTQAPKVNTYIPTSAEAKFSGTGVAPVAVIKEVAPIVVAAPVMVEPIAAQKVIVQNDIQVPVQEFDNRVQRGADAVPYNPADSGYKEGYESLDRNPKPKPVVQAPIPVPRPAPVAVEAPKMVVQKIIKEDTSLPAHAVVEESSSEQKLVITKIIDKPETKPSSDPFAGRVLGKIDDRVLGNGYDGASTTGKLGMRVTKNAKPVSAWIEVFKNGTKERVKTFYTSKGRSAKTVKLPAGTYMVRATYRSRDSKQQKTLNNISIKEGGSVTKSIGFHDGKVKVIAQRNAKPLYVKVIAYKSGTHNKVSYDFSSRNSGIATLSLDSGTYDIEVLDHEEKRAFDSIRIRGGQTETINADF